MTQAEELGFLGTDFYLYKITDLFPKRRGISAGSLILDFSFREELPHGELSYSWSLKGGWKVVQLLDHYEEKEANSILNKLILHNCDLEFYKKLNRIFSGLANEASAQGKKLEEGVENLFNLLASFREESGKFFPSLVMRRDMNTFEIFFYSHKEGAFKEIRYLQFYSSAC